MRIHRREAGMAAMMLAVCLTGCSLSVSYQPEKSGIFLAKDGTVQSAEIEPFDNSGFEEERYKEDELKAFVEEAVSDYNKDSCGQEAAYVKQAEGLTVCIVDLGVKDKTAKLILEYASVEDYMAFNANDPSVTSLAVYATPDAVGEGILLDQMKDAEGKAVDTGSMANSDKYSLVVISGDTEVVVDGEIKAVSEGVVISDKHTAEVSGENALILFK